MSELDRSEFDDILKIIAALVPLILELLKDIKKARETGNEQEIQDCIRRLDTERVRKLILGEL